MQRSSDDGEPAGTAGAPMLEVLRGAGVSDVAAVVSRWFGGTLLGAGGLVRAYGGAVRAALAEAGTLRRSLLGELALELDHADAGRVEGELRARGVTVLEASYGARVRLLLAAAPDELEAVTQLVASATSGAAVPVPVGDALGGRLSVAASVDLAVDVDPAPRPLLEAADLVHPPALPAGDELDGVAVRGDDPEPGPPRGRVG